MHRLPRRRLPPEAAASRKAKAGRLCANCHQKEVKEYSGTVHGLARKGGSTVAATCTDCHGLHDIRRAKDPTSRTNHANLEATCGKCHGNDAMVASAKLPGGNIVTQFHDSIHGRALTGAAAGSAPTCTNCHGAHTIRAKSDPDSATSRARIPDTCGSCHKNERAQFASSQHGKLRHEGNLAAPGCNDCHSAHRIQQHTVANFQTEVIKECGNCHADYLSTYRDTFHGQVTALGYAQHGHLRVLSRLARDPARVESGVDGLRAKPAQDLPEVSCRGYRELRQLRSPREPAR
jgi:nitrate/TMAO reductase-like tetraheme cytochrome c subunit